MGFTEPTPIQLRAFPIVLAGKDLIGTAQTGTGKTAAFALPILTLLAKHADLRCLVLEPTRELAAQVETAFRDYGRFTDLQVGLVHGGVGYGFSARRAPDRRENFNQATNFAVFGHVASGDRAPVGMGAARS